MHVTINATPSRLNITYQRKTAQQLSDNKSMLVSKWVPLIAGGFVLTFGIVICGLVGFVGGFICGLFFGFLNPVLAFWQT